MLTLTLSVSLLYNNGCVRNQFLHKALKYLTENVKTFVKMFEVYRPESFNYNVYVTLTRL